MKNLLKSLWLATFVVFAFTSCTNESPEIEDPTAQSELAPMVICAAEDPIARLTNNSAQVANFEIYDDLGNLLNSEYNLNPGEDSDWLSFRAGTTYFNVFTATSNKTVPIDMGLCMAYDVTIDVNNQLDTDQASNR